MDTRKTRLMVVWVAAFIAAVPTVWADSQDERIARLEAQLAMMQQELAELKSQRAESAATAASADEQAIHAAVDRAVAQRMDQQPNLPDWLGNVTLSGDFRYRHEWTQTDHTTDEGRSIRDRNRHRIQARIGLYGIVNDEIGYGFRVASGNNASPTSNNQDMGDGFSSKNLWLDLAYADYHPAAVPGLNVYGGKINNPYYRVGNSDLLLDTDVTPEGIAATYKTSLSETLQLFGTVGGYYVQERRLEANTSLWGTQIGTTWQFGPDNQTRLTAGAGYYNYGNLKGRRSLGITANEFYGNRSTADNLFASDFDLVQGFAELSVPVGQLPLRFFGDYICNTAANSGQNMAYLVGASLGRTTVPGTWAVSYNYRDVQADALLGVLSEATFGGGGTDLRGHKLGASYQLAKNTRFAVTYMPAKRTRDGETKDFDVTMVDFTFRF